MVNKELEIEYRSNSKDLDVIIRNIQSINIKGLELHLIEYETQNLLATIININIHANGEYFNTFKNVPSILISQGNNRDSYVIVRAVTNKGSYENDKIQLSQSISDFLG